MKRHLQFLLAATLMAYAMPASAATLSFEAFAPGSGLDNVSVVDPHVEAGFTLTPTNSASAVFDAAHGLDMPGNATDWFGFEESNAPSLTMSGGGPFDFTGILAGPSTIASGLPIDITITGNVSGGGVLVANLTGLTTATPFAFAWNNLTSLTFTTTDDAGLDDIQVTATVPEPSTLLLLGAGLGALAARRRSKGRA